MADPIIPNTPRATSGGSAISGSLFSGTRSYIADLFTPVVRVGVTGLARSGKTVFITSLVQCLCDGGAVPSFARLRSIDGFRAYLEPQPDDDVPRFSFEDHLRTLSGAEPSWPSGTRQTSQLRLTLEWDEPDTAARLQRFDVTQRLHVDIIDYPGEWLIDLAMLGETFQSWSRDVLNVARSSAMNAVSEPFLSFVDGLDAGIDIDEQTAIEGARIFTQFLKDAREQSNAGNVLGPGRFLMPGDLEGSPQLTFFPVVLDGGGDGAGLLERRFESYKANIVKPFFVKHFSRIDRQIVLVDVLSALNGGAGALQELEHGLENVLRAFRPGKNSWLSVLMGRRIDRIVFAATKADHIHGSSRNRLQSVLEKCVARATKRSQVTGAKHVCLALAALRATQDVEKTIGDDTYRCVRGVVAAGERVTGEVFDGRTPAVVFPGDLPVDPLDAFDLDKATGAQFKFAKFRPPAIVDAGSASGFSERTMAWPHINLDAAFSFLLGDDLP